MAPGANISLLTLGAEGPVEILLSLWNVVGNDPPARAGRAQPLQPPSDAAGLGTIPGPGSAASGSTGLGMAGSRRQELDATRGGHQQPEGTRPHGIEEVTAQILLDPQLSFCKSAPSSISMRTGAKE